MPELTDAQKVMRNSTGLDMLAQLVSIANGVSANIDMVAQLERIANGVSANINLGLTGAAVGDLVRVAAIDANGKPTAWTHVSLGEIVTNQNLVHNGCFIGGGSQQGGGQLPINQRGQEDYNTASSYCIDGWFLNGYPPIVTLSADGLTITKQAGSSSSGFISQIIDIPYSELAGRKVTMSVLYKDEDVKLATGTNIFPDELPSVNTYVISLGSQIPHGGSYSSLRINSGKVRVSLGQLPGNSLNFIAVKLEMGDMQTLAHKEIVDGVEKWVLNELPDYSEELLKCQRYFQVFRTQALRPTYRQDYRPEMAANPQSGATDVNQPTLGTITIDGTTYYTASAES